MQPDKEFARNVMKQHVKDIAVSLGVALLDTFRMPIESIEDRDLVINRWEDLASNICAFGEYLDDSA